MCFTSCYFFLAHLQLITFILLCSIQGSIKLKDFISQDTLHNCHIIFILSSFPPCTPFRTKLIEPNAFVRKPFQCEETDTSFLFSFGILLCLLLAKEIPVIMYEMCYYQIFYLFILWYIYFFLVMWTRKRNIFHFQNTLPMSYL